VQIYLFAIFFKRKEINVT